MKQHPFSFFQLSKKGQVSGGMVTIGGMITLVIVIVVAGLINVIGADIQQDVTNDQVTGAPSCGTNSTGGSGGTILYTACPAYEIGNASLNAQLKLGQRQNTVVTAVIGIFLIGLLVTAFAGRMGAF